MTVCNMSIEAGARAGLIAPDETTYEYLRGRPFAPADFDAAVARWQQLPSDEGARYDRVEVFHAADVQPQVTWGTNPGQVVPVGGRVPAPADFADPDRPEGGRPGAGVHGPGAGHADHARSRSSGCSSAPAPTGGSRTCARRPPWSAATAWPTGVDAMVVPGSGLVKRQAEAEGLDRIFTDAGLEWREPGCSMCLAMNPDKLEPGQRCASTSNRNFEGRQGKGGRTHLVSPAMAAAAAVAGRFVDVREWEYRQA